MSKRTVLRFRPFYRMKKKYKWYKRENNGKDKNIYLLSRAANIILIHGKYFPNRIVITFREKRENISMKCQSVR